MKKSAFASRVCLLAAGLLCCFVSAVMPANAQADKPRPMTMDEYRKAKAFAINDLETETYVKFENAYVLDRYEMKPPYVFKYTDGIERRVYLYRMLDNKTKQPMGMVAVYQTPANGKKFNVCIPSPETDKAVWAQYIDDLKDYNKAEAAFGSAFAYVLSREMASLVNGGATAGNTGNKTDYDVCFPGQATVTMADGTQKPIAEVKAGEQIASYNRQTGEMEIAEVLEVQTHEGKAYELATLLLTDDALTASTANSLAHIVKIQATPNHPLLTQHGRKAVNQLKASDLVYVRNPQTGEFGTYTIHQMSLQKFPTTVTKVYNLVTDKQNYLVNDAVVLDK